MTCHVYYIMTLLISRSLLELEFFVSSTMSKRKSSIGSDDGAGKHIRTSERANRGQGGRADQLTRVGEALVAKPPRKKVRGSETFGEPINPMAPAHLDNSRSKQKSLKVCVSRPSLNYKLK